MLTGSACSVEDQAVRCGVVDVGGPRYTAWWPTQAGVCHGASAPDSASLAAGRRPPRLAGNQLLTERLVACAPPVFPL